MNSIKIIYISIAKKHNYEKYFKSSIGIWFN